ncbi:MAG: DUF3859 domain-containing protein [Fimbriimonadaceae bacterium]|nr:DUF3859 domain-containing protein [Fimbriimonadaceae bacterium]
MRSLLFAFLVLFSLSAAAVSSAPAPFRGVVEEAGTFEVVGARIDSAAPDTAAGKTSIVDEIRLIEAAHDPKAELGITFGFRYRLEGVPSGDIDELEMRAIHPVMKGLDGTTRDRSTAPEYAYGQSGGAYGFIVYTLSEPFEVVPGPWHIQLLYKGRVVISQEFILK